MKTPPRFDEKGSFHVAIIMDGNGRWARARCLPRIAGHRQGAQAVRRVVEVAPGLGISTLTLYAFSSDNWNRPADEVAALMQLLERNLVEESDRYVKNGVAVSVIGRRDRLDPRLVERIRDAERISAGGSRLHLRIAVDYSSRFAIASAAAACRSAGPPTFEGFSRLLNRAMHSVPEAPDVDLLIRTSGEQRLSDFLLWECAYAELFFTERRWPDFGGADLAEAVGAYHRRERRFGRLLVQRGQV